VTLDIDRHLPEVRGDDTQLQQVMINLLQTHSTPWKAATRLHDARISLISRAG
jgi:nitrogen-specific signal transduction histidine kinase